MFFPNNCRTKDQRPETIKPVLIKPKTRCNLRSQIQLASACLEGLTTILAKVNDEVSGPVPKPLFPEDTLLGLRIAKCWCEHVIDRKLVYGPMAAWWVANKKKLAHVTWVSASGWENVEVWPEGCDPMKVSLYEHGNLLGWIKHTLLDANVWSGIKQPDGPREAPSTPDQLAQTTDLEIERGTSSCCRRPSSGSTWSPSPMGRLSACELGRSSSTWCRLCWATRNSCSSGTPIFMSPESLGLAGSNRAAGGRLDSWWVSIMGDHYIMMSMMDESGEMKWFRNGLNYQIDAPGDLDLAVPDHGQTG